MELSRQQKLIWKQSEEFKKIKTGIVGTHTFARRFVKQKRGVQLRRKRARDYAREMEERGWFDKFRIDFGARPDWQFLRDGWGGKRKRNVLALGRPAVAIAARTRYLGQFKLSGYSDFRGYVYSAAVGCFRISPKQVTFRSTRRCKWTSCQRIVHLPLVYTRGRNFFPADFIKIRCPLKAENVFASRFIEKIAE